MPHTARISPRDILDDLTRVFGSPRGVAQVRHAIGSIGRVVAAIMCRPLAMSWGTGLPLWPPGVPVRFPNRCTHPRSCNGGSVSRRGVIAGSTPGVRRIAFVRGTPTMARKAMARCTPCARRHDAAD